MRREDWLPQLLAYVESVRKEPYDPVRHNCALFVSGAVAAITGQSPKDALGIQINSEQDVEQTLQRFGGVRGICEEYIGPMLPPKLAGRGDVVIRKGLGGETLGVCMGAHALFLCPSGLQPRELTDCDGCWKVE